MFPISAGKSRTGSSMARTPIFLHMVAQKSVSSLNLFCDEVSRRIRASEGKPSLVRIARVEGRISSIRLINFFVSLRKKNFFTLWYKGAYSGFSSVSKSVKSNPLTIRVGFMLSSSMAFVRLSAVSLSMYIVSLLLNGWRTSPRSSSQLG